MKELLNKLSKIQKEIKAPKNLYNSFGKYHYRNAEGIFEAFKEYEEKYNVCLIVSDEIIQVGERIYVKAIATLMDCDTGSTISATAYARESSDKKGMDDSQITGTASSYARKYALNGLLLLDDTKDADTDEYQNQNGSPRAKKAQIMVIESICKKHGIRPEDLYKANKLKAENLTEMDAARLLNSLKNKFGDD